MLTIQLTTELHGGAFGSTVALQQEGPGFNSRPGLFLHGICMFSLCTRGFSLPELPGASNCFCDQCRPYLACQISYHVLVGLNICLETNPALFLSRTSSLVCSGVFMMLFVH
ncbi:hypothetical protein ILYODFUR_019295 [Ilyodon furcidens]|uniref:Uncharacterized protein n=1 Tax=Ilyodon furcidens TaxID=33524 RepID=A0ABV0TVY6_9TELE